MTAADLADRLLDEVVAGDLGICVHDGFTNSDEWIFRGPHGRLESWDESRTSEGYKRGPYVIEGVLRSRLISAINGSSQWTGWQLAHRRELQPVEPVVSSISQAHRCERCLERFPSGNAFSWHLADTHRVDCGPDENLDYATEVLDEAQRTFDEFTPTAEGESP